MQIASDILTNIYDLIVFHQMNQRNNRMGINGDNKGKQQVFVLVCKCGKKHMQLPGEKKRESILMDLLYITKGNRTTGELRSGRLIHLKK